MDKDKKKKSYYRSAKQVPLQQTNKLKNFAIKKKNHLSYMIWAHCPLDSPWSIYKLTILGMWHHIIQAE